MARGRRNRSRAQAQSTSVTLPAPRALAPATAAVKPPPRGSSARASVASQFPTHFFAVRHLHSDGAFRLCFEAAHKAESAVVGEETFVAYAQQCTRKVEAQMVLLRQQLAQAAQTEAKAAKQLAEACTRRDALSALFEELRPRLSFNLHSEVALLVYKLLGLAGMRNSALVSCEWRDCIKLGKSMGLFNSTVLTISVGNRDICETYAAICTERGVYTVGNCHPALQPLINKKHVAGDGYVGQLGHGPRHMGDITSSRQPGSWAGESSPRLVQKLKDEAMTSVTACDGRTMALTRTGELWGWGGYMHHTPYGEGNPESRWLGDSGAGSYQYTVVDRYDDDPELSEPELDPDCFHLCVSVPKLVKGLTGIHVVAVSMGELCVAAITIAGEVFSCGVPDQAYCLGHGPDNAEDTSWEMRRVDAMIGHWCVQVSSGGNSTVVLTTAGELFSWGWGVNGCLGHGGCEDESRPRQIQALEGVHIVGVGSGSRSHHTAAWTQSGAVYTWGSCNSGALCHGDTDRQLVPRLVQAAVVSKAPIGGMCASSDRSAFWLEDGRLVMCGSDRYRERIMVPYVVDELLGKKVVQVSMGSGVTMILVEGGKVYTLGVLTPWDRVHFGHRSMPLQLLKWPGDLTSQWPITKLQCICGCSGDQVVMNHHWAHPNNQNREYHCHNKCITDWRETWMLLGLQLCKRLPPNTTTNQSAKQTRGSCWLSELLNELTNMRFEVDLPM